METNFSSLPIFISSAAKDTRAAAGKTAFSEAIPPPLANDKNQYFMR